MAPRPKTYGARRSHIKPAAEPANGTTADKSEYRPGKVDFISMRIPTGREKGLRATPKEEKQNILSPGLVEKDALASGDRRKGIRRSVDGLAVPQNQNLITENGFRPTPIDHASPSYAKATFGANGVTEAHKQHSINLDIDLEDKPSDLHNLGIWVAQLIRRCHQNKNHAPVLPEQRQTDSKPQPGQHLETTDVLQNVEGVRMTRGKEKKRLQQLKGKELANGHASTDLSGNSVTGSERSVGLKDAAPIERPLKAQLNDQFRQRLFGSSNMTDVSTNVMDRNTSGALLYNTLVDIDNSDRKSAAVLNTALEERNDDAPFVSALKILASSSEVMSFINFYYNKADRRLIQLPDVAGPSLSTGTDTSGATTVTDDLLDHLGTPVSDPEDKPEPTIHNRATDSKNTGTEKRSLGVIEAFEAATTILVQIQQGEASSNYTTPYASGSMFPHFAPQHHLTGYGTAYGPPFSNPPTLVFGPPTINNYVSPFAPRLAQHPNSYASPYSDPVNQIPTNYASPYANPMVPNSNSLVGTANIQPNHHTGAKTRHDNKEAHTTKQSISGSGAQKGNSEAASQHISSQKEATRISSKKAGGLINGNEKRESKAYDEATGQGISNGKDTVGNAVDLNEKNIGESKKKDGIGENLETNSKNDMTDDDLPMATPIDKKVTPPAEDHRLFTGERLGDFTSVEKIDWLLTIGNGGKMPTPRKKRATKSPSESPLSQADNEVQIEVSKIIDEIMSYKGWPGHPGATTKQLFYASLEGQRLVAELKRLMVIAKPVVNVIVTEAESEARSRFYRQLESRAVKEKRDREFQGGINQYCGPPVQIHQWIPPVTRPTFPFPVPQQLPSNSPMEIPFIRRGNVIAAPPGGRNIEEEQKAETYGYPPTPGSRPGDSQQGQKRKRSRRS